MKIKIDKNVEAVERERERERERDCFSGCLVYDKIGFNIRHRGLICCV